MYQRVSDDPPRWRVRQSGRELSFPRGTYNSSSHPSALYSLVLRPLSCLFFYLAHSTNRCVSTRAGQLARVTGMSRVTVVHIHMYIIFMLYVKGRLIYVWRDQNASLKNLAFTRHLVPTFFNKRGVAYLQRLCFHVQTILQR